jgi:cytidylate kinase
MVCISRVTGAGGEAVGEIVAERLGFRYVDDEVLAVAARKAGVDTAVLEHAEHYRTLVERILDALFTTALETESYFARRRRGDDPETRPSAAPPTEDVRRLMQEAIVEIAQRGQAVIVAHAASMALGTRPGVLRVHVTASEAMRVRRLWIGNKLVNEDEYRKAIAEADLQRAKYLERFYDVATELPTHYDLVINTDVLDVGQAAAAVVAAATAPSIE